MWLIPYNLCWTFLSTLLLPLTCTNERFKKRWSLTLPSITFDKRPLWIHALSVGEVLSVVPLIDFLLKVCNKNILLTVTTKKGMEIAEKKLKNKVEILYYFPFDFWWSVKRFVDQINPSVFILIETDIWPFLLYYLNLKKIKSFLVNGRISPKTYFRYTKASKITKYIFNYFELCMVQSELDRNRLIRIGIDKDKVIATGNIKFDRDFGSISNEEKKKWKNILGILDNQMVLVAGSTHPGEEEVIFSIFKKLKDNIPAFFLIIAPRDVSRAKEVFNKAKYIGLNPELRSKCPVKSKGDVIVVDSIGELARLYGIADIAFVGGSLVAFGGHNIIEPAYFGCPVIFGPHMFNFKDISEALLSSGGGIMVNNKDELYKSIFRLIKDLDYRMRMRNACYSFVQKNRGAVKKVVQLISSALL